MGKTISNPNQYYVGEGTVSSFHLSMGRTQNVT